MLKFFRGEAHTKNSLKTYLLDVPPTIYTNFKSCAAYNSSL